jgi:hypothetical protein
MRESEEPVSAPRDSRAYARTGRPVLQNGR